MMRCDEVVRLVDDYVDGALASGRSAAVAEHLAGCVECRRVETETRRLLAAVGELPREVEPSRDLWPGIAERLGAAVVSIEGARAGSHRRRRAVLAAAAVLIVVATAAITARLVGRRDASIGAAAAPTPGAQLARHDANATLAAAIADYGRAASALRAELAQRRGGLDPATRKAIDANLAIVDSAIAELTRAVASQPGNRDLALLLAATCRQQIELLQTANTLSRT